MWLEMSKFLPTFFDYFSVILADPDKQMAVVNKYVSSLVRSTLCGAEHDSRFLAIQDGPEVFLREKDLKVKRSV